MGKATMSTIEQELKIALKSALTERDNFWKERDQLRFLVKELEAELSRDGDQIVKSFRERYDRLERAEAELTRLQGPAQPAAAPGGPVPLVVKAPAFGRPEIVSGEFRRPWLASLALWLLHCSSRAAPRR
jgi:hypothetical protein